MSCFSSASTDFSNVKKFSNHIERQAAEIIILKYFQSSVLHAELHLIECGCHGGTPKVNCRLATSCKTDFILAVKV